MKAALLSLAAGALLALSLPPFDQEWLGWIALAPLLVAARGRRPVEAMGLGLLAGLLGGGIHVGLPATGQGVLFAYLPFLWLAVLLGVAAAAATLAWGRWAGARGVLFIACAGVAVEWLTTFSPLPLHLALCQYRTLAVIQIAAVTGIWGVSLLLWWCNAAVADAILQRRLLTPATVAAMGGLLLAAGYGWFELAEQPGSAVRLRVAAIQDHTPGETDAFMPSESRAEEEPDREELTRRAAARGARLIVWTEGCLGAAYAPDAPINPTAELARELGSTLVVGYSEPAQPRPFNCAAIVGPDGEAKGIHRKIHLFLGERQAVQPGQEARAFPTNLGRVGVEICFDSCYTGVTRRIARDGAQIVVMPNYDPPTPRAILHRLHAALLPFRAVENHVPFVRADPNGLCQIVDASGRIVGETSLYTADALVGDVALSDGRGTPFTRLGDWLAYLCLLVTAACVALSSSNAVLKSTTRRGRESAKEAKARKEKARSA